MSMNPELVAVLVQVLRRTRNGYGQVPLSARCDEHEKQRSSRARTCAQAVVETGG